MNSVADLGKKAFRKAFHMRPGVDQITPDLSDEYRKNWHLAFGRLSPQTRTKVMMGDARASGRLRRLAMGLTFPGRVS